MNEQMPGGAEGRLERLVGALCAMRNDPPKKFGWMEQSTLDDACQLLSEMKHALNWYAGEADAIARHVLAQNTSAMLASMQVLALDGGKRADKILRPNARLSRGPQGPSA